MLGWKILLLGLIFAMCCSLCGAQTPASPWPCFRHDWLATGRSAFPGPDEGWERWNCEVGGQVSSSPVLAGDCVYTRNGTHVVAVSLEGDKVWSFPCADTNRSSPAVGPDGTVYAAGSDGYIYAVNPDGTFKWKKSVGGTIDASPTVGPDGSIYIGSPSRAFVAFDRYGTRKFAFTAGGAIASSAAVASDGSVYFGCDDGYLYALKPDGSAKWKFLVVGSSPIKSSPSIGPDGTVYFGATNGYFYAVRPDGKQRWRFFSGGAIYSSAALAGDGSIFFGSRDGYLYALSSIGALKWKFRVGNYIDSSPAVDSLGRVYIGSSGGAVHAVNPDGTLLWTHAVDASVTSSPALGDGGCVYVLDRGGRLRSLAARPSPPPAPVVMDDGVYASSPNTLHAQWTLDAPTAGIARYEYAIGTSPGSWDVVGFTDVGQATETTRTDLPLVNGANYYFAVRAIGRNGLVGEVGVSDGIRVDFTPPPPPAVFDDGKYTSQTTSLHFRFSASDSESGIGRCEYSVGKSPGVADVVGWHGAGLGGDQTVSGLALAHGVTYFANVRAHNGAGLVSVGSSDGILVDTSPPVVAGVQTYAARGEIRAGVDASDPESGVDQIQCALSRSPDPASFAEWKTGAPGEELAFAVTFEEGVSYYVLGKARNGAGLWSEVKVSAPIVYKPGVLVWTKFRGDTQNSGCADTYGPNVGRLRWKVQTSGYVESSAAVSSDGTAYVGSSDGRLYAISPGGYVRWTYQTGGSIDSSPAIDRDGLIYFGSYDRALYCLHPDGSLKWRFGVPAMIWSSPTIGEDGCVYFGCQDGRLYAVNSDGTLRWRFQTGGAVWSSPALGKDGSLYVGSEDGRLYAVGGEGTLKWAYQTNSAVDSSPALDANGNIYFGSGDGTFYSVNPNGTLRWRVYLGEVVDSSPAVTLDGRVYFGTGVVGAPGAVYAYTADGSRLWRVGLPGGVRSSPAVSVEGIVYVGCADKNLYAFRADGQLLWKFAATQSILSSPALTGNGAVIVGSDDGAVYCFGGALPLDSTPPTVPVVYVDRLITSDMKLTARWSSTDPESSIAGYSYAVGTSPGASDVTAWTDVGRAVSVTISGLAPDRSYYVSVVARNSAGLVSGVGVSDAVIVLHGGVEGSIGAAKTLPWNTTTRLPDKVVTAIFDNCAFVEEPNRSAGIRCMGTASRLVAGMVVSVTGKVGQWYGEAALAEPVFEDTGTRLTVSPMAMPCAALSTVGLSPLGLLVRVTGRVAQEGKGYFVLTDGSFALSARGIFGLEVRTDSDNPPPMGMYVGVTGIACREVANSIPVPVVRMLSGSEATVYSSPP